ncbi:hypothetical protein SCARR_02725 [Pontiella sulfatireligans]|uniref:Uncharacterized protein n=1 Tax=Pontiella sulfatireligans TaxID=2750658 RepID=A0A6C2UL17_9BACT|nr:hypothetical protein SCARR_02725 [Pontiella sulfatireligans]
MEQKKGNTPSRKGKHLNRNERIIMALPPNHWAMQFHFTADGHG